MGRRGEMENNKPQLMTITDKATTQQVRDDLIRIKKMSFSPLIKELAEKNIERLNQLVQK